MATLEEIGIALKNADKAGDTLGAQKLAAEYQRQLAQQSQPKVGVGEDVGRSIPSGLKRGTEALAGSAEDTGSFAGRILSGASKWLGFDKDSADTAGSGVATALSGALNPVGAVSKIVRDVGGPDVTRLYAPSSETVHEDVNKYVPGASSVDYQPQTRAGKFMHTGMEFLPGAVAGPGGIRNILTRGAEQFGTGLISEGAGQATEGTAYEPWARTAGGLVGAGLMSSLARHGPPTPEAQRMLDEGVDLSAGQATGSRGLKYAESELGGGTTQGLIERQREQFSAARMAQLGEPAGTLGTGQNMERAYNRIGNVFNTVGRQAGDMPMPIPAQQAIKDAVAAYNGRLGPAARAPIVQSTMDDIGALFGQNGNRPVLTGAQYSDMRSMLGEEIRHAENAATAEALRSIQETLDNAMEAHLTNVAPDQAGQLATARQQYRLYLDMERGLANEPAPLRAKGVVTGPSLAGGVKGVEGNRRLVQGQSEFAQPAGDAAVAMEGMPESGSSSRIGMRVAGGLLGAGEPISAVTSLAGPWGLGKLLMNRRVQSMLMSAPEDARAALTAIIAAHQAEKGGAH